MGAGGWTIETITVVSKTYPECSKTYGCLVCTAGISSEGNWRRLYPIPWALFWKGQLSFDKWDVISVPVRRNSRDRRSESYRVNHNTIHEDLKVVRHLANWGERRQFLEPYLDADLEKLKEGDRSLGLIKPREVIDFLTKPRDRISDPDEVLTLEKTEEAQQQLLFDIESELVKQSHTPPQPLPWMGYKFMCQGSNCSGHEMMCIDWEIQELYRKTSKKDGGSVGFEKTRQKALSLMDSDLHFVVGTTWRYKRWMIVGIFYPPTEAYQGKLQI